MEQQNSEQPDPLIANILRGDEETLKAIYRDFRDDFLHWAQRTFNTGEDDAADTFQDAVIILYRNVASGRLTHLSSSLKSYLFGIGKNLLKKKQSLKGRITFVENIDDAMTGAFDLTILQGDDLNHRQQLMRKALGMLTDVCREIIFLFYYKRYSMEAIKEKMGYNSEEVARSRKKKCMTLLTGIVKEKLGDQFY